MTINQDKATRKKLTRCILVTSISEFIFIVSAAVFFHFNPSKLEGFGWVFVAILALGSIITILCERKRGKLEEQ